MGRVVSAMLLLVAVIHLLPVSGVLGADQLTQLYGVAASEPNLAILMRHRAVLLGLLGALCAGAAFVPGLQTTAFIAGFMSVGSFLLLAFLTDGYNAHVGRVVTADLVAAAALVVGSAAHAWRPRTGGSDRTRP
jgi:hypothetical protein